jgi:glycosyltransferase involved in cell wall biosynthesis
MINLFRTLRDANRRNAVIRRRMIQGLAWAARIKPGRSRQTIRRVVHVSPAYFDRKSYIGGGERYPTSLAGAMAELIDTRLVTFGPSRESFKSGSLQVEVYPVKEFINGAKHDPHAWRFLSEIYQSDVVHCHQYTPFVTTAALYAASVLGRATFVTDLGGEGWNMGQKVRTHHLVTRFCPISEFAIRDFERERASVIYGGVSPSFMMASPAAWPRKRQVLFVGRLLPHKGINYLIEAMPPDTDLLIMGSAYHADYFELLQRLCKGKRIKFVTDATDADIATAYRESVATVLPSVHTDCYGTFHPRAELLGLTLLESQANGTPAICTAVGGMPEFVKDGVTGFVVPPNDPSALRDRIIRLLKNNEFAKQLGLAGRRMVEDRFTWRHVAESCLKIYATSERRQ